MAKKQKSELGETLSTIIWAVGIALILRTFLFQPFHIPSGSMLPGLMDGDYIITSKYSVGYGRYAAAPLPFPGDEGRFLEREPKRGDVIVFRPEGNKDNYIKRLIGLPGDKIQIKEGKLFINNKNTKLNLLGGETYKYIDEDTRLEIEVFANKYIEELSSGRTYEIYDIQQNNQLDNTRVFSVPEGMYFMLGDNRDNSKDSRVTTRFSGAGFVPASNIIGRAEIVLLSVNNDFVIYKPWTWANMRGDRFFKRIK